MQTARIDEAVAECSVEDESQKDGEPHHHDGAGHEPLPDAELVGTHHLHTHYGQEQYDEIGSYPEASVDESFGYLRTSGTGIILDLIACRQEFTRCVVVQNALVGRSCKEE